MYISVQCTPPKNNQKLIDRSSKKTRQANIKMEVFNFISNRGASFQLYLRAYMYLCNIIIIFNCLTNIKVHKVNLKYESFQRCVKILVISLY